MGLTLTVTLRSFVLLGNFILKGYVYYLITIQLTTIQSFCNVKIEQMTN